jgi:hypothetical protein
LFQGRVQSDGLAGLEGQVDRKLMFDLSSHFPGISMPSPQSPGELDGSGLSGRLERIIRSRPTATDLGARSAAS